MYKVTNDFTDGLTGEQRAKGEIIEVDDSRIEILKGFIEPLGSRKPETEMLQSGENAILAKPKNKVKK